MEIGADWERLVRKIVGGEPVPHSQLDIRDQANNAPVIDALLASATGRRWLRLHPNLDTALADRLLEHDDEFTVRRRDRSLIAVIERASLERLRERAPAIASGSAAAAFWSRLATDPASLVEIAGSVVERGGREAADATLFLLALDPHDAFNIGDQGRLAIARRGLGSEQAETRGLAAEFLAQWDARALLEHLDAFVRDDDQRTRAATWLTGLRLDRAATTARAHALLGDEAEPLDVRRSALVALGMTLPTADVSDLLTVFVVHPSPELARDAADLLDRFHRNPTTAEAARASPHAEVRELAERLLDPTRGSPAAGGSRPGDPTRSSAEIYAGMLRQLEERERAANRNDTTGR